MKELYIGLIDDKGILTKVPLVDATPKGKAEFFHFKPAPGVIAIAAFSKVYIPNPANAKKKDAKDTRIAELEAQLAKIQAQTKAAKK